MRCDAFVAFSCVCLPSAGAKSDAFGSKCVGMIGYFTLLEISLEWNAGILSLSRPDGPSPLAIPPPRPPPPQAPSTLPFIIMMPPSPALLLLPF